MIEQLGQLAIERWPGKPRLHRPEMDNAVDRREQMDRHVERRTVVVVGPQDRTDQFDEPVEDAVARLGSGARGCVAVAEEHGVDAGTIESQVDVGVALPTQPIVRVGVVTTGSPEGAGELLPGPLERGNEQGVVIIEVPIHRCGTDLSSSGDRTQTDQLDGSVLRHEIDSSSKQPLPRTEQRIRGHRWHQLIIDPLAPDVDSR